MTNTNNEVTVAMELEVILVSKGFNKKVIKAVTTKVNELQAELKATNSYQGKWIVGNKIKALSEVCIAAEIGNTEVSLEEVVLDKVAQIKEKMGVVGSYHKVKMQEAEIQGLMEAYELFVTEIPSPTIKKVEVKAEEAAALDLVLIERNMSKSEVLKKHVTDRANWDLEEAWALTMFSDDEMLTILISGYEVNAERGVHELSEHIQYLEGRMYESATSEEFKYYRDQRSMALKTYEKLTGGVCNE